MPNERRFVLDANVIISALLFPGKPPYLALAKAQEDGIILLSGAVFTEIKLVLERRKFDRYLSLAIRQELINDLANTALFINPLDSIEECRDTKDNKYLELAVSGQADCLITGDEDLLVLHPFRGIPILTDREFLENFSVDR